MARTIENMNIVVLFVVALALVASAKQDNEASEMRKTLTRTKSSPALIQTLSVDNRSMLKGVKPNKNKVSIFSHFVVDKYRDHVFNSRWARETDSEPDYSKMTDEQVIQTACTLGENLCKSAVDKAKEKHPKIMASIADSIRKKPDHVRADKLLKLRLAEVGLKKAQEKGYDETADAVIGSIAMKNPYTFAANKAIDYAVAMS